eukprot:TRINITY_DN4721_c0_g1_i4.p1 TRINITY_DN4721_c0_g1~~TRINITY_DN4721_c0_g1_i4.p1  ORF type:complete len:154 (-),score=22.57 TRINITY_DN4721_c0_g1_i4:239-700(-)
MPTKSLKAAKGSKGVAVVPKPAGPKEPLKPVATSDPQILTNIEKLKLLSKLEKAGVLSALEKNGITLKYIEENKLLSKAEDLGVIRLVADRSTPSKINTVAFLLLAAAAGSIFAIPDDTAPLVAAQVALGGALVGGALAAFAGSSLLSDLQKS